MMIRVLDAVISLFLIILLLPVFVFTSIGILLADGSPVFFLQNRVGKAEKLFIIYKFRSMYNSDESRMALTDYSEMNDEDLQKKRKGFKTTQGGDKRITPIGKVIRKYSIDELPQLINVFFGSMSLVGPRPDLQLQKIDYSIEDWKLRCSVKPGITGLAQINGRSSCGINNRIENDLIWVNKRSLLLYLKIIILTPFKMWSGTN